MYVKCLFYMTTFITTSKWAEIEQKNCFFWFLRKLFSVPKTSDIDHRERNFAQLVLLYIFWKKDMQKTLKRIHEQRRVVQNFKGPREFHSPPFCFPFHIQEFSTIKREIMEKMKSKVWIVKERERERKKREREIN